MHRHGPGRKTAHSTRHPPSAPGSLAQVTVPAAVYARAMTTTEREIERLVKAAGNNRYGHRDATMILLAYRHGLRASELTSVRWEQSH